MTPTTDRTDAPAGHCVQGRDELLAAYAAAYAALPSNDQLPVERTGTAALTGGQLRLLLEEISGIWLTDYATNAEEATAAVLVPAAHRLWDLARAGDVVGFAGVHARQLHGATQGALRAIGSAVA